MIIKHILKKEHEASDLEFFELDDYTCGIKRKEHALAVFNAHSITIKEIHDTADKFVLPYNKVGFVA
jgi:hypothetical protein